MLDAQIAQIEREMSCSPEDWGLFRRWVRLRRIVGLWPELDYNAHIPNLVWLISFISDVSKYDDRLFVGGIFHGRCNDMREHEGTSQIRIPVLQPPLRYYRSDEVMEDDELVRSETYVRYTTYFGGLFNGGRMRFWGRAGQNERGLADCARDIVFQAKKDQLAEWGLGCQMLDRLGPARGQTAFNEMLRTGIAADVLQLRHDAEEREADVVLGLRGVGFNRA